MSDLFEQFWLAGMRKCKKKQTKPLFNRLLKEHRNMMSPEGFTEMLVDDIHRRLDSNQLGFDKMHPTTYLNGERWDDEYSTQAPSSNTFNELTDRSWADNLLKLN